METQDTTTAASKQQSRSPSPPSHPPVPTAPGPRATALQKLYNDAITHVLKTCNYTNFSACFPTPASGAAESLKDLHEQFTHALGDKMGRNFEEIMEEREVVGRLNELDSLIEDARRRQRQSQKGEATGMAAPPHTLPAQQLYHAYLAPSLRAYSTDLKERQDAVQEENVEVLGRVMQQRKEIEGLVKGLEGVVGDLSACVATLQSEGADVEGLGAEIRAADEDIRMVE